MRTWKQATFVLICCAVALASGAAVAAEAKAPAKGHAMHHTAATLWPADQIKWPPDPDYKDIMVAALWGDSSKGAYGALEKWAAGTEIALHTHSFETKGVVVSGTLAITMNGKTTEIGPGSYVLMPANVQHATACKAGAGCVFFAMQPGKGDAKLVGTGGK